MDYTMINKDQAVQRLNCAKKKLDTTLLGKHLGYGRDGNVFMWGQNEVIKITKPYPVFNRRLFKRKLSWLKKTKKHVVNVIDFGRLEGDGYWYTMQYLPSEISSNEDWYVVDTALSGLKRSRKQIKHLPKAFRKAYKSLKQLKYKHTDKHCDNVRMTKSGVIKLIDLESFL